MGMTGHIENKHNIQNLVKEVIDNCTSCNIYKRTPSRPIVGLEKAQYFNELVSMDMGEIEGKRFLVMVDELTGYVQAAWTEGKPTEIVGKIIDRWISVFGTPT